MISAKKFSLGLALLFSLSLLPSLGRGQTPEGTATLPGSEGLPEGEEMPEEIDIGAPPPLPDMPPEVPSGGGPVALPPPSVPVEPAAPAAPAAPGGPTVPPGPAVEAGTPQPEGTTAEGEEELVYLNVQDQDIKEVIKQISKATSRNFIIDAKVAGKVTILSNRMMTREEAYQAFLSALEVAGFTTVEGPGGILKIVALRDAKNYPIPTHVDTTPYTDRYITRLIKLDNISAGDMAEAIKGLISRNGNLFAYDETNTLVLTDSGTNIDRLMKIIKELDQEGPQEVVEIIPIHFASAKDVATILGNLFQQQASARGGRRGGGPQQSASPDLAKVSKIIDDERTNSIIVLASKRDLDKVKELINRLDSKLEEGQEGKIHVHYLKHATAKDLVAVLQGLAGQAAKPPGQGGAAGGKGEGPVIASLEDFSVAADDATNALLITSTPKTYRTLVEKVIDKLDIPRKQVYLEAMVIEFSFSHTKSLGVTAHAGGAMFGNLGFGQSFKQIANLLDPFSSTSSTLLSSPGLLGGLLSRTTVRLKVTQSDGTVKEMVVPAFSAFINALDSFGDTNLVASPNLLALDNEEASIEIIRKEPEPGQSTLSATGAIQQGKPERIEAGLRLKLTPQITERGTVRMKIDQQYSSFATAANTSLGTQAIVERKVATSVVTNDGQTVVIGGLMEDKATITKNKIPILGDIPLFGWLFRTRDTGKTKSNLLLFITPHIIRDNSDFAKVLERKVGHQSDFMEKYYKKRQREKLKGIIDEHHKGLLDIAKKEEAVTEGGVPPVPPGTPISSLPPVITARPEDEERRNVTIILPPAQETTEEDKSKETKVSRSRSEKKKKEPETPVVKPIPPSSPQESIEAEATPVIEEPAAIQQPAPEQPAIPPVPPKKKKKKPEEHPPVITLPPGGSLDLSD